MTDYTDQLRDALGDIADRLLSLAYQGGATADQLKILSDDVDAVLEQYQEPIIRDMANVVHLPNRQPRQATNQQDALANQMHYYSDLVQKCLLDDARGGNIPDVKALLIGTASVCGHYLAQVKHPIERKKLELDARRAISESLKFNLSPTTAPAVAPAIMPLEGGRRD